MAVCIVLSLLSFCQTLANVPSVLISCRAAASLGQYDAASYGGPFYH